MPRVVSNDLQDIMNGDEVKIKCHLRVSVDAFRKIVEYMPMKRGGWSVEYEVGILIMLKYLFKLVIVLY